MSSFFIDTRSLLFVLMAVAVIECLSMLLIWLTRKTYPGFGLWTAANAIFAVAFFLIALRGIIPDVFTILLANVLIMGAAVLFYEGTMRFRGLRSRKVIGLVLITLMALTIFYFRFVDDLIGVRIIAASILLATVFGLVAWSLLYNISSTQRLTYWIAGCFFTITSVFMLARAVFIASMPSTHDFFDPNFLQTFTFLLPLLLSIPWTFCFFILNSERLELEFIAEINERRIAAEALTKSEEQYRLLIETLPLAVFVETLGKIVYVNPAFLTLFKASTSHEVIGMRLIEFVHPELFDIIKERRRIMTKEKGILPPLELKFRCMDGSFMTVVSTPMPIIFQVQPSILSVLYDITERKRSEIELQKAHKLLQIQSREIEDLRAKLKDQMIRDSLKG